MSEESGWLIERGDSETSRPLYWGGEHCWTYDNIQAIRFARKQDGESQAKVTGNQHGYIVCEHG